MTNYTNKDINKSSDGFTRAEDSTTLEPVLVVNCVLNAPLMVMSITGNALVLAAIIRTPSICSISMAMLCSLAVSDLLVGLIVQPVFIANEVTTAYSIESLYKITAFVLCGVSLCTMTAISVDRYIALRYPMRYQTDITLKARIIYTLIITIWLCNISFSVVYFWNWAIYFAIGAVGTCLCLFFTTFSYIRIYSIVRHHQVQIQVQHEAVQSSADGNSFNMVRMKRSALNTFIFYIAMILCYVPIMISLFLSSTSYKYMSKPWHLANTVVHLNSSINPILYCWRLGELRTAVFKTLRKLVCKKADHS